MTDLYIVGLTTDHCVKYSAFDAIDLGFKTYVIKDACRPVNLNPNDEAEALEEMRCAGVILIKSEELYTS